MTVLNNLTAVARAEMDCGRKTGSLELHVKWLRASAFVDADSAEKGLAVV